MKKNLSALNSKNNFALTISFSFSYVWLDVSIGFYFSSMALEHNWVANCLRRCFDNIKHSLSNSKDSNEKLEQANEGLW